MPRIRTLKPEHRQHRKVGPLTDRHYRLWVSMILEADDEGRLICHTGQLRALTWAYDTETTTAQVEQGISELARRGLIEVYEHNATRYAAFPSWPDHQVINKPRKSRLPRPPTGRGHELDGNNPGSVSDHYSPSTGGREVEGKWKGSGSGTEVEGKGVQREGKPNPDFVLLDSNIGPNLEPDPETLPRSLDAIAQRIAKLLDVPGPPQPGSERTP